MKNACGPQLDYTNSIVDDAILCRPANLVGAVFSPPVDESRKGKQKVDHDNFTSEQELWIILVIVMTSSNENFTETDFLRKFPGKPFFAHGNTKEDSNIQGSAAQVYQHSESYHSILWREL